MKETYVPVESVAGIISGRDAIYLDAVNFTFAPTSVKFVGELNCALCSDLDASDEFTPYDLVFTDVSHFRMIELDLAQIDKMQSSFDVVNNSGMLAHFRSGDDTGKLKLEHLHFVLATYDDYFEIVAADYSLVLESVSTTKSF